MIFRSLLLLTLPLLACSTRTAVSVRAQDGGLADVHPGAADTAPDAPTPTTCAYVLKGGPTQVSQKGNQHLTPSLAHSGKGFGVTWLKGDGANHPLVQMRLMDHTARPVGAEFLAGTESHSWAELAYSGQQFGVCWHSDPGMKAGIGFRRVSAAGATVGSEVQFTRAYNGVCADLLAVPGGWVATLTDTRAGTGGTQESSLGLALLGSDGKLQAEAARFARLPQASNLVSTARAASGELFVAYRGGGSNAATWGLWVQRFSVAGALKGPARQISSGSSGMSPELLWAGGRLLLFYAETDNIIGKSRLQLQRLDSTTGAASGQATPITSWGGAGTLSAAWTGAEVALSWIEQPVGDSGPQPRPSALKLTRLRPDGTPLQTPLKVTEAVSLQRTQIAGDHRVLGVAWYQPVGTTGQVLFATAGCP